MKSERPDQSFETIIEHARLEIPEAPDLRAAIRRQIENLSQSQPLNWLQILLNWASFNPIRYSYAVAFAALLFTSYWELSRPESPAGPPMPMFVIDQFFSP